MVSGHTCSLRVFTGASMAALVELNSTRPQGEAFRVVAGTAYLIMVDLVFDATMDPVTGPVQVAWSLNGA